MNDSNYINHNYYNSNNQDNIINSIYLKQCVYNVDNDDNISNTRKNVSKPSRVKRLRNNCDTR